MTGPPPLLRGDGAGRDWRPSAEPPVLPVRPARTAPMPEVSAPLPIRRRWARVLSKIALGLSVLIFLMTGLGYAAYRHYESRLSLVTIHPHESGRPAPAADTKAQNFLLVGSDTRDFAGGAAFQAAPGSPEHVSGQRSDTVLLVHLPAGRARATVVSFPRDSFVTIPAYADSTGRRHPAHPGKLNEAFAVGGAPLLVELIEDLTRLRVDHYVQMDFAGFEKMVDVVGGVTLCVGTSRHDPDSGDFLTAGVHHNVRGAQALAFARDRKGLPNGDIDRIKDQQYFLSQMLKKTLSAGTLANPIALHRLLTALTGSVTVDRGFGFAELKALATRMRHLDPAHVLFTTIPFTTQSGWRTFEGARQSVVVLDPVADARLFDALRRDSSPASTPRAVTTARPATPRPSPTGTVSAAGVTCAP